MTQIDRYYFFLFNALTEPNVNPKYRYFFDLDRDTLIMRRSNHISNKTVANWKELPKLTYREKKDFLGLFLTRQKQSFKGYIERIITEYKEDSSFNFSSQLKKINPGLAFEFEMQKGSFLHQEIDRLYGDLGLNENLSIDFSDVQKGVSDQGL